MQSFSVDKAPSQKLECCENHTITQIRRESAANA